MRTRVPILFAALLVLPALLPVAVADSSSTDQKCFGLYCTYGLAKITRGACSGGACEWTVTVELAAWRDVLGNATHLSMHADHAIFIGTLADPVSQASVSGSCPLDDATPSCSVSETRTFTSANVYAEGDVSVGLTVAGEDLPALVGEDFVAASGA